MTHRLAILSPSPRCPACRGASVFLEPLGEWAGVFIGGLLGAASLLALRAALERPPASPITALSLATAALLWAHEGRAIGRQVDQTLLRRFHCTSCDTRFTR